VHPAYEPSCVTSCVSSPLEAKACMSMFEFSTGGFEYRKYVENSTREGGLTSRRLYKENNKLRDWKTVFTPHIPPWASDTYDFVVQTSLTHPRKIILVVLQIGKAKDLSTPLRI
jgi:hypothetical protein